MGIKITAPDTGPYPRPATTIFECDRPTAFFCRGFMIFDDDGGDAYSKAMKAGWKESPTGTFICPECSGK